MSSPFGSFPFDASGIDNFSHPLFITAERAPTTADVQAPGTFWLNSTATPRIIFQTTGAGVWLEGGNSAATTTTDGVVMIDTVITGADDDTTVGTSKAIFDYGQTLVLAGANIATEAVQGIGFTASGAQVLARTANTPLLAFFVSPEDLDVMFSSPSAIGDTAADSGAFTALSADGTGAVSLGSNAAGDFSVTGAGIDLTLDSAAGQLILTGGEAAINAVRIQSDDAAGGIDVDAGTGGITIDSTGAISLDAAAASNYTVTGAFDLTLNSTLGAVNITSGQSAADSIVIQSTIGGIDILASGAAAGEDIDISAVGSSININSDEGVTDAINIDATSGGVDIDAAGVINIGSSNNGASAIVLDASAGGVDILASGAVAGEDINITATGSSVNVNSTEDAAFAIYLHANGGVTETVDIHADQGTNVASVNIHSDVGGLTLTSGLASADAININASDAAGGIDIDCGSGGFIVDAAAGAISLDSALASNFTVTGAVDLTLASSAGSVVINAEEAVADAIQLTSAAGGLSASLALQMSLVSTQAAANAVVIDASNAAGGIDMDCGSGGFALDAAAGAISLDSALASNFTVTGAVDLTLSSTAGSIVLSGGEAVADAIQIQSAAGGVDLDGALQVNIASSQNAADAVRINASAGGIDIDAAGAAGEDINLDNAAGSINLTSGEAIANSMVLSAGGGMDILAPSGGAGLDIDITNTGGSVNITASESAADAVIIDASGAAGAIQLLAGTGGLVSDSGRTINVTAKTNADTPYAVLGSDHDLTGDTSAGVLTFTLPAAPATGRELIIYDIGGSAGANNITIDGNGNNVAMQGTVAATKALAANYSSASLIYNGTIWMARYTA